MARFYSTEFGYGFEGDGIAFELSERNLVGYKHRSVAAKMMDMIGVEDPRDEQYWTWFRYNQDDEAFEDMMMIANEVGTVVLRSNPLEETEQKFYNRFGFHDIDNCLGELDDTAAEG